MRFVMGIVLVNLVLLMSGCAGLDHTEQRVLSGGALGTAAGVGTAAIVGAPLLVGAAAGAAAGVVGGLVLDELERR